MEKPSVVIALAMYYPQKKWLREQLVSLNLQDYPNLRLLVWNDGNAIEEYRDIFQECVTKIPYQIIQGGTRLGTAKVFEELTKRIDSDYIAYCDQDDIWEPSKITTLVQESLSQKADLLCSDASVIDENGKQLAASIGQIRPRQRLYFGIKTSEHLLTKNFAMGCTILVKSQMAKQALPFPACGLHDWWLALYVSVYGRLAILREPLIKYRVHGANQTGMLKNINSRQDYYEKKILGFIERMEEVQRRFRHTPFSWQMLPYIAWGQARKRYFEYGGISSLIHLLRYIHIDYQVTCFELCIKLLPAAIVPYILRTVKG